MVSLAAASGAGEEPRREGEGMGEAVIGAAGVRGEGKNMLLLQVLLAKVCFVYQ